MAKMYRNILFISTYTLKPFLFLFIWSQCLEENSWKSTANVVTYFFKRCKLKQSLLIS